MSPGCMTNVPCTSDLCVSITCSETLEELELPSSPSPSSQEPATQHRDNTVEGDAPLSNDSIPNYEIDDVTSSSPPPKRMRREDLEQSSPNNTKDCLPSWDSRYRHLVLNRRDVNSIDFEEDNRSVEVRCKSKPSTSSCGLTEGQADEELAANSIDFEEDIRSEDVRSVEIHSNSKPSTSNGGLTEDQEQACDLGFYLQACEELWSEDDEFDAFIRECQDQFGGGRERSDGSNTNIDSNSDSRSNVNNDVENYSVTTKVGRMNKKFNVRELIHAIRLHPRFTELSWRDNFHVQAIEDVVNRTVVDLSPDDRISVYINQRGMQTPLILDLTEVSNFTVESILGLIEKMMQSNDSIKLDTSFEIHITILKMVRGGVGKKKLVDLATDLTGKKSVIVIPNDDIMCAARAIVVGSAHLEQSVDNYIATRRSNRPGQRILAVELCDMAGVDKNKPASLADIRAFENVIGRKIVVISADILNKVAYAGSPQIRCERPIFLYHHHNHFDLITNPCAFYGRGYYCYSCLIPYYNLDAHKCARRCDKCYREDCTFSRRIACGDCNRVFYNDECFRLHKVSKRDLMTEKKLDPMCKRFWKCTKCGVTLQRSKRPPNKHKCGEKFCFTCQVYFQEEHKCYIKKKISSDPCKKFIFFDFETIQETEEHIPNYCVAHICCEGCISIVDIDFPCAFCKQRQFIFQGPQISEQFCKWLFSEENSDSVALAHNLKGFDGVFILKYLIQNGVKPDVIYNGSKIMSIEVACRHIRVIDSLNHLPMALANLPKAFQLQSLCKGFFPYLFNSSDNQDYVGPIPDVQYYDPDSMFPETRETFLKWYGEQRERDVEFDFQAELKRYAIADVDILRKACLTFRKVIMQISSIQTKDKGVRSVDPFNCITLASLCFEIYRHMFLQHGTIAKVPAEGITGDQFSRVSIVWLEWLMYQANGQLHITHALNGREKRIGPYRVDGFDDASNTVYFFDGDFWHGNPSVYRRDSVNEKVGKTMGELYQKTLERRRYFETEGYNYVTIWENEFHKQIEENMDLKTFADSLDVQERLDPRDAIYGGRCNASKLFYEAKGGERIPCYDFCSLYPSVNKYGVYPRGYPEVITKGFQPLENYTGFVKAKVLPPGGLYHPVLPYRCRGKLMFPLCKTCCENGISVCNHSDEERSLIGTWVTLELLKAAEKGYTIVKVYEVLHFRETMQYDGFRTRSGLFTPYINAFLKIKQEASGWPEWVQTESDRKKYVQMYCVHEGISLDASKIEKNPGLRSVAKLCLNSLWGKFSQRPQMRKNTFVTVS